MKTLSKKLSVFSVLLLIASAVWFQQFAQKNAVEPDLGDDALKTAVNECDGITERAASHLVAVVEFQKLEIVGRKARVFKLCMQDHGYVENTNWLKYNAPLAKKIALDSQISIDEALENLRRANMLVTNGENERPQYWVLRNKPIP
jgi:hypothetical protein